MNNERCEGRLFIPLYRFLYSMCFIVQRAGLSPRLEVVIGQGHLLVENVFYCGGCGPAALFLLGGMPNVMDAEVCVHVIHE